MKKIGFVDYFISEWHANNYPAWIERICAEMGVDYKVAYAWAELDSSPVSGVSTDEWCEKFGTERCASIEELCEKSDYKVSIPMYGKVNSMNVSTAAAVVLTEAARQKHSAK